MKQTRSFLLFTIVTLLAFSSVLYTSCHKTNNPCNGVVCYNGGVCVSGGCSCPTGYSGNNCELSPIKFRNNSFTPVTITVNGTTATIAANGGTTTFLGTSGSVATVYATTSGAGGAGELVTWSFNDYFPTGGNTQTDPLDVSAYYYYLEVTNNDPFYINGLYANYSYSNQTFENISIPNDGYNYGIGYYGVNSTGNTKLSFDFTDGAYYTTLPVYVPNSVNTYIHVTVP